MTFLFILCCFPAFGCNSSSDVSDPQQIYAVSSDTIDLYDTVTFYAKIGIDENRIEWSSSDSSVIKVNGGVLTALKEGKANVIATYDGTTQRQTVNVIKNQQYQPQIDVEDFSVLLGEQVELSPTITFKGSLLENTNFSVSVSDQNVVQYSQGKITGISTGSSQITICAQWNGIDIASKTIDCTVNSDTGIYTDKHNYVLYIIDNVRGVPFTKSASVYSKVYDGGAILSEGDGISWVSADENVVSITESGLMVANSIGKTTIKGSYLLNNKIINTVDIPVEVKVPVLETNVNVIIDMNQSLKLTLARYLILQVKA